MAYLNQYLYGICFGGGFITAAVIARKLFEVGIS